MLCVSHSLFLSVSCIFMGVLCADAFEFMFALSFAIFRNLSSIRKIVFYMRHSTLNHNYSTELAVSGGGLERNERYRFEIWCTFNRIISLLYLSLLQFVCHFF